MSVDAIIIDFPSTALTEALMTDKPIFVCAGRDWMRMFPRAIDSLKKGAWVSETRNEFEVQVRKFLAAGDFAPLTHADGEFATHYMTYMDDGRSAGRRAEVIVWMALAKIASPRFAASPEYGR